VFDPLTEEGIAEAVELAVTKENALLHEGVERALRRSALRKSACTARRQARPCKENPGRIPRHALLPLQN